MKMTPEEEKRRQEVAEQQKKIIAQLNDTTDLQRRIREGKKKHNELMEQLTELPLEKVATPPQSESNL